ncbi:hypothetical protein KVT40_009272 [Elsinoe batatas]|uniref:Zn(2)-C6 fungal-type domain-containing protein n=1 Tax=Elsinoe batatas TaxID=2601811 RepID=A0A8K0KVI0_9PEZI|nr:hypothetical protein KVT40_009272 [Elsinoe batatas]
MSISVQASPSSSFDHFGGRQMDQNPTKFTAVNGASHRDHQHQSFTFRPDSTATMVNGSTSQGPAAPEASRETANFGYARNPSEMQSPTGDSQAMLDNITLGKRKRSLEEEHPTRRPDSHQSPGPMRDAPIIATALTQTPSTTSPVWVEPSQTQSQPRSPDETQFAESLRRDIARYGPPGEQHMRTSPHDEEDVHQHATQQQLESGISPFPKKRTFAHRTKTGCHTCRRRKKKCDEGKPHCMNCLKGSFHCEGYGEKKIVSPATQSNSRGRASTGSSIAPSRSFAPQTNYQPYTSGFDSRIPPPTSEPGRRSTDVYPGSNREPWGTNKAGWPNEMQNQSPPSQAPSHTDQARPPNMFDVGREAAARDSHLVNTARLGTAIAPATTTQSISRSLLNAGPATAASQGSGDRQTERNRMLVGQPFLHYCDPLLVEDRRECRAALERYNNSTRPSVGTSEEECGRLFKFIIMPELKPGAISDGRPSGSIGRCVLVEAPFTCEYGYNIHLGDDVVIGSGCTMQDAAKIRIGSRSIVGPNVRFYTMTLPTDRRARGGARSLAIAAPITIEEDCFIGADVIILPGRKVGKGSTIGAGTVVSKDVPENCVVAGSPPKVLRFGLNVQDDPQGHHPARYRDEELSTLMVKPRGYTLTTK